MRITQVTPGIITIPPNGWGAVEKVIWEYYNNIKELGHECDIKYLNEVDTNYYLFFDILQVVVAPS